MSAPRRLTFDLAAPAIGGGLIALGLTLAPVAQGQAVRVTGTTSIRLIGLRPLVADSVPLGETQGDGILRRGEGGELVRCVEGAAFCHYQRPGDSEATVPGVQDLTVSAWGLGEGIRAYGRFRARASLADGGVAWPRADDAFDALVAYVELDRPRFRVRAGRQWRTSGLGYYNFDGGSVEVRASSELSAEVFGGWSLARGLNEPRTGGALATFEPFAPDDRGLLVGGQVVYRPEPGAGVSAVYQREIRQDRRGLYSERAALDAVWRHSRLSVEGQAEIDLTTNTFNEARLDLRGRVWGPVELRLFARRYRPFFEAWTIWGAFEPVGFNETGAAATWRPDGGRASLRGDLAWRSYDDASASTTFGEVRTGGWRIGAAGALTPAPRWTVQADAHAEVNPGAAVTDGSVRVAWSPTRRIFAGLSALAFRRQFEFRVNEGTVWGLSADGGYPLGDRTTVSGSVAVYHHSDRQDLVVPDWSQVRASLRVRWTVGPEPGMAARTERGDGP